MNRRDFLARAALLGAVAGSTGCVWAYNGETHHQPIPAGRSDGRGVQMTDADLKYTYDFLAQIAYHAPTPLHLEIESLLKKLHLHFQPWYTDSDPPALAKQCDSLLARLKKLLPVVAIAFDGQNLQVNSPYPLNIARGLPAHFIVDLANRSQAPAAFSLSNNLAGYMPLAPVSVPPAQSRPIFTTININKLDNRDIPLQVNLHCEGQSHRPLAFRLQTNIQEPALVKGTLYETGSHSVFPARLYAKGPDNIYRRTNEFAQNQTLTIKDIVDNTPIGKQQALPFNYSDGTFEVLVPPGKVELTLERGYEHTIVTETHDLKPGQLKEVTLSSGRFYDMKAHSWISGDTHIHWVKNWWDTNEDLSLLAMVQRAEDLRVANNLTLLQYRPEPHGTFIKPDPFPMGPVPGYCDRDYHIQMAEEYRNDNFYGHICLLNIKKLIQPIATGPGSGGPPDAPDYPLNFDAIHQARRQGGISTEAHNLGPFHRSDVPVNAVLGLADCFDQLEPQHYYRFLDAGLQIPLGNGSDHPARLAGYCRMYVKVDGPFTYENWIDGIRQRRTFTTSGPLIFLTVNGHDIGSILDIEKGTELTVRARVLSRHPIGHFQVVTTAGRVIKEIHTREKTAELEITVKPQKSTWFTARCSQDGDYYVLNGLNRAHTSAIYVHVDGKPALEKPALKYWIDLTERHKQNVAQNANYQNDAQRQRQLSHIQAAIDKYRSLLQQCTKDPT